MESMKREPVGVTVGVPVGVAGDRPRSSAGLTRGTCRLDLLC